MHQETVFIWRNKQKRLHVILHSDLYNTTLADRCDSTGNLWCHKCSRRKNRQTNRFITLGYTRAVFLDALVRCKIVMRGLYQSHLRNDLWHHFVFWQMHDDFHTGGETGKRSTWPYITAEMFKSHQCLLKSAFFLNLNKWFSWCICKCYFEHSVPLPSSSHCICSVWIFVCGPV